MNSSKKDYSKLYQLQDKFLSWWFSLNLPFYLTGGTALGRFYLNHRFSEDLDFFINSDSQYQHYISELKNKITHKFTVNIQQSVFADDYTRFFITDDELFLKIEFVTITTRTQVSMNQYTHKNRHSETKTQMNNQQHNANNSEVEFEFIGLYSFFNDENDKNINWTEFFHITNYCK